MTSAPRLTPRQRAVVVGILEGRTCPEIARRLGIKLLTVRAHVRAIRRRITAEKPDDTPALRLIRKHGRELLAA